MRSFVFISALLFLLSVQADQVFLTPLGHHKVSGEITIHSSQGQIYYQLDHTTVKQGYAVVVYEQGNCQSYSSPVIPLSTDKDGVTAPFDWQFKNALIHMEWGAFEQKQLDTPLPPHTFTNHKLRSGAASGHPITNIDFKNKVLVVEETDANKPNGVGVACGIHP